MNIAKETGWSERDILNMSYARSYSYMHAILRSYGKKTYFSTGENDLEDMFDMFLEFDNDT